jgi:competence protein ComEA
MRPDLLALVGLGVAVLLAGVSVLRAGRPPDPVPVTVQPATAQISVHVVGEVVWPGLYVLEAGSRLQDAIFAAHGPTVLADLKRVNLAAVLRDGDRVVIPRIHQPPPSFAEAEPPGPAPGVRAAGPPDASTGSSARGRARTANHHPVAGELPLTVNVNTATAEELDRLPGIGPVLARRIVEFREARGLFRRLDDLQEVKGIGPKLYRRLEPMLRLEDGTPGDRPP